MKRNVSFTLAIMTILTLNAQDIDKYRLSPDYMQQLFCGIVSAESKVITLNLDGGHYFGYSRNNSLFGWGSYSTNSGNRWIGQYNKGKCIFGIYIKDNIARVGSDTHYTEYDLTEGTIRIISRNNEQLHYDTQELAPYRFVRLNYEGGDYYLGETKNGVRHGQGIYFWSNGNYWYGTFSEGYRQGYGALFKTDGTISHGLWYGDDKQF